MASSVVSLKRIRVHPRSSAVKDFLRLFATFRGKSVRGEKSFRRVAETGQAGGPCYLSGGFHLRQGYGGRACVSRLNLFALSAFFVVKILCDFVPWLFNPAVFAVKSFRVVLAGEVWLGRMAVGA